jgi:hypothetical protein
MPNEFRVKRGLIVEGSGSNVVIVDGVSGRLFAVNDSFSGSLFSVNTIAGLPVIEAFSDNTVRIGQYGSRVLYVSQSLIGVGKESALTSLFDVSGSASVTGSFGILGSFTSQTTFNRVTGSYTLVLSDASRMVEMSASVSGTYNITVPSSSTVNYPNGTNIDVSLYGTGSIFFTTASAGVVIRSANNWLRLSTRYGAATLIKISGNEWYLIGNINP